MKKKSSVVIGLTLISLLLCGCRRGSSTSSTSVSQSSSISSTSGITGVTTGGVTSGTTGGTLTSSTSASSGSTSHSSSSRTSLTTEPEPGDYYARITNELSGDSLRSALHELNDDKIISLVGYDGLKTFAPICDANPNDSSEMIGFYDNARLEPKWDGAKTWNREHVWPNSRGGNKVESDAFMARPCSVKINSKRGSKGYGYASYDPYTDDSISNKVAYYRGVSARIIFYCMIACPQLKLVDEVYDKDYPYGADMTMATLSDLLEWNLMYLPSDTSLTGEEDLARRVEINRNEIIYSHPRGQGNRNPFVDHPSYACRIWGNTNSKTKAICGM